MYPQPGQGPPGAFQPPTGGFQAPGAPGSFQPPGPGAPQFGGGGAPAPYHAGGGGGGGSSKEHKQSSADDRFGGKAKQDPVLAVSR